MANKPFLKGSRLSMDDILRRNIAHDWSCGGELILAEIEAPSCVGHRNWIPKESNFVLHLMRTPGRRRSAYPYSRSQENALLSFRLTVRP